MAVLIIAERRGAEAGEEPLEQRTDDRHRSALMRELPAHHKHEHEAEEEKDEAGEPVLDPDDLVIGREDVFAPPVQLMVIVMRVVMTRMLVTV